MVKTRWVCGFAISKQRPSGILLIEKKRGPANMAGKLNGIGGKIELGEGIRSAQAREFEEETGVKTDPADWKCFHIERYRSGTVYFMTTPLTNQKFWEHRTLTDERVVAKHFDNLDASTPQFMDNMAYLIPMLRLFHQPGREWPVSE